MSKNVTNALMLRADLGDIVVPHDDDRVVLNVDGLGPIPMKYGEVRREALRALRAEFRGEFKRAFANAREVTARAARAEAMADAEIADAEIGDTE